MKDNIFRIAAGRWRNWRVSRGLRRRIKEDPGAILEDTMQEAMRGHSVRINLDSDGQPRDVVVQVK